MSGSYPVSLVPLEQWERFKGDDFCFQPSMGDEAASGKSVLALLGRVEQVSEGTEGHAKTVSPQKLFDLVGLLY
jgi:hypothetical protein